MSYLDDEPDPDRRALLGLFAVVPVLGGAELLARGLSLLEHRPQRFQIPARTAIGMERDRFPFDKAAQAAEDRMSQQDERRREMPQMR